ncbi:MAG TPA: amidohydrolase family protein [Methylomirabilota bacterium]|nr:amidohydrolase family protein [Methylomirabilota bacterium]
MSRLLVALLALALSAPGPAAAQYYPIFDAHIHYSRPDWDAYTPERILSILARAGVRRALVSSTPDDGTLLLYDRAPAGIVPSLRPYRTDADVSTWPRDPAVAAYVEKRLERGVYRAIGESHFGLGDVAAPVVKRVAELAARHRLFLWCHVDDATVEAMLTAYPGVKLLWAHAGMSAPPRRVGELVDRHPTLWVELALRGDVAPGGALDPEWRALFQRHPDRFLVGTDTWVTSRWESVRRATEAVQQWLQQLPREVAEQIAWKNGERLFPPP